MKKVLSIVLYIVTIASIIYSVIEPNAEAFGIPSTLMTTILLVITTVKELVEKLQLFTEEDMVDFANYSRTNQSKIQEHHTKTAIENWKRYR